MLSEIREKFERWDGPNYQDVLDADATLNGSPPIPDILREQVVPDIGPTAYSASRYTSPDFFRLEVENVFLKTWQFACREDDISDAGDTYVFDLVGKSLIVVRQKDGGIRAFENVCLHRGRKLVTEGGCKKVLRCPYHAFTWSIDGAFQPNKMAWDFPEIDPADFPLPEVPCDTWGGFVFVSFNRDVEPLADYLDPLPRHFARWKMADCYRTAHVAKVMPANWKAVTEAFLENHHVAATHPQIAAYTTDANSQYDVLSDTVTRAIAMHGQPGLNYLGQELDAIQTLERIQRNGSKAGQIALDALPSDTNVRGFQAGNARRFVEGITGRDLSEYANAEFIDGFSYDLFPNFHIWGGLSSKISYRIRPVGLDHEQTLLEVFTYRLKPVNGPTPEPAKLRMLGPDELWASAEELGFLAPVYDQDQSNMGPTQDGLRALGDRPIHFALYSEIRCRNVHRMIDRYIERFAGGGAH